LQGTNDEAIFRRRNAEGLTIQLDRAGVGDERIGDRDLLSGLAETRDVNLDELGKPGNNEIPFIGKAIAPTSGVWMRFELALHDGYDVGGLGVGKEVEIVAQVGPVIERLDDDGLANGL
jgi:hypothetical protein